jgi:hypothetical protein
MGGDDAEHSNVPATPALPAVSLPGRARDVIDARFRVLWRPLQWLRAYWWAIGAYAVYCAVIWGVAALVGWVL